MEMPGKLYHMTNHLSVLCNVGYGYGEHLYPSQSRSLNPYQCNNLPFSDQGEEGVLGMEDGKPSDNDRADTETCQKTHAEPPLVNGHHDVR